MFDNLTKEIIFLSVVPVAVILLADLIAFIFLRSKENQKFRFNYFIKISIILAISFVLPLIIGYTLWVIVSFSAKKILYDNIMYIALLIFLSLCLFVLLIWIYLKSIKYMNSHNELEVEEENVQEETEEK